MKKSLFILLLLIVGIGLWFYLLLGKSGHEKQTKPAQEPKTTVVKNKPTQPATKNASATTSKNAPPNTDAGMEFPTI